LNADRAPQLKASVGWLLENILEVLMRIITSTFALILAVLAVSCVQRPRVVIKQGNPQQFFVSAQGILDHFEITGPSRRCEHAWREDRLPSMETYWLIVPVEEFNVSRFAVLGPITYGKVPKGFKQVTPANGEPPTICEGGPYNVTLSIKNGPGVSKFFAVYENSRIVSEGDDDRWWKITP
jgi:hypothetical protein